MSKKLHLATILVLGLVNTLPVSAQQAPSGADDATAIVTEPPSDSAVLLDTIVVKGVQPGPGLWRVSRGDHELWILGSLRPLPNAITWKSA